MFEISYSNLIMLLATIPEYKTKDEEEDEFFEDLASEADFAQFFNSK